MFWHDSAPHTPAATPRAVETPAHTFEMQPKSACRKENRDTLYAKVRVWFGARACCARTLSAATNVRSEDGINLLRCQTHLPAMDRSTARPSWPLESTF